MTDLSGKTALVTGGSRGIGRGIVEALAAAGCRVAVTATTEAGAEAGAAAARQSGNEALAFAGDVRDSGRTQAIVDEIVAKWGSIDILVNNAGITRDTLLMRMSDEDIDGVIDTNLKGAMYACRAVAKPMLKQRAGTIINISSIVGITGNAGQSNYAAAKAGIHALTRSLAKEFGSRGIRVNAIAPGYIETDMTKDLPAEVTQGALAQIPLSRLGETGDIARAALFLASDDAAYITGTTLVVDGGMSI